jgi:DNA topoisomerase-1
MKTLIIVESPSKAKTIQGYLGRNFTVLASRGHIADLAKGSKHGLGVDIANNFKPHYILLEDKLVVLDELLRAAKEADRILLASDPDKEGEAIAWHLAQRLADVGKPIQRIVFNEIKKSKIQQAIKSPRDIDMNLFHSQEARRILDRIVGFSASPFLMTFFGPNLSAGRVQSVVSRMIVDREQEIKDFVPVDFWTLQVKLDDGKNAFVAKYVDRITDQATAQTIHKELSCLDYLITEVKADSEQKYPSAPLITSTLQRLMSKQHGFGAERTMKAAQGLYESGLCTYIRTDSVRIGEDALQEVREWLREQGYTIPSKPQTYKNKEAAQDAHECIRPSNIATVPWDNCVVADPDERLVYEVIWRHFVASQMIPAIYDTLVVLASPTSHPHLTVRASGKALRVKGYLEILGIGNENGIDIPNLTVGQKVSLSEPVKLEQKQTQPPPRYSEDKLIKELVNRGIGRPATYAQLLGKITERHYVEKKGNVFHATDLGKKINEVLLRFFSFMDYDYTAKMEGQLDEIENGKISCVEMLGRFYPPFQQEINRAYIECGGSVCEKCQNPMIMRNGKNGKFWACIAYPQCRFTKPIQQVA